MVSILKKKKIKFHKFSSHLDNEVILKKNVGKLTIQFSFTTFIEIGRRIKLFREFFEFDFK